ncbi:MAG: hypothetical protein IJ711_03625 [Lachnospiraceae bacterium]|nr:hypothetical protein [Lachnospiraceae bacterium]
MIKNFFTCGTVGWCLEILFTACNSIKKKDYKLMGNTSLWMFPIYGMAATLAPLSRLLKKQSLILRGSVYTVCIFATEFLTGSFLKKRGLCPWSYEKAKYNVAGVIRLDYAPLWFGTGLLYEFILTGAKQKKTTAA